MNGPAFLKLPSHLWPRIIEGTTPGTVENVPTRDKDNIQTYSLICNTPHTFVDYKRFSSWKRLLRSTFYILKTLDLATRRLSKVPPLSKSPNQFSNKKPSNRGCQTLHHTTLHTAHTRRWNTRWTRTHESNTATRTLNDQFDNHIQTNIL